MDLWSSNKPFSLLKYSCLSVLTPISSYFVKRGFLRCKSWCCGVWWLVGGLVDLLVAATRRDRGGNSYNSNFAECCGWQVDCQVGLALSAGEHLNMREITRCATLGTATATAAKLN
jgi:hypothetical protein